MSDQAPRVPRRPGRLVLAWVAMWIMGLGIMSGSSAGTGGYASLKQVYDPLSQGFYGDDATWNAYLAVKQAHTKVETPLSVAEMLLGGLLLFVATRLLLGGKVSRGFALQVILANLGLVIVGYGLREPFRMALVPEVSQHQSEQLSQSVEALTIAWWWRFRIELALRVITLGLCALAFRSQAARAYFGVVGEAEKGS